MEHIKPTTYAYWVYSISHFVAQNKDEKSVEVLTDKFFESIKGSRGLAPPTREFVENCIKNRLKT